MFKMQIIILFNISIRLSQSLIRHRSEARVRAAVTTKGTPPAQPSYNSTLTIIPSIKNTMLISVRSAQGTPSIRSICNSASKPRRLVREASTINDDFAIFPSESLYLYVEVSARSFETSSRIECIRDMTR